MRITFTFYYSRLSIFAGIANLSFYCFSLSNTFLIISAMSRFKIGFETNARIVKNDDVLHLI